MAHYFLTEHHDSPLASCSSDAGMRSSVLRKTLEILPILPQSPRLSWLIASTLIKCKHMIGGEERHVGWCPTQWYRRFELRLSDSERLLMDIHEGKKRSGDEDFPFQRAPSLWGAHVTPDTPTQAPLWGEKPAEETISQKRQSSRRLSDHINHTPTSVVTFIILNLLRTTSKLFFFPFNPWKTSPKKEDYSQ